MSDEKVRFDWLSSAGVSSANIEAIERRLSAARWPVAMQPTKGDAWWVLADNTDIVQVCKTDRDSVCGARAEAIACLPLDMRALLDEVKTLRARLALQDVHAKPFVLDRPLAVIDIEATGPTPDHHIIDLAAVKLHPDGTRTEHQWRINPGVPIPSESTAIHGITDDDVALCDHFDEQAESIAEELKGCDLAGYSIRTFDEPILRVEFKRADVPWPCGDAAIVDAMHVFKQRASRTLSNALVHFTGRPHVGAHGAMADARATVDVLLGELLSYPDLPRTVADLDRESGGRQPDWASSDGALKWDANGDVVIAFGTRNVGLRLVDVDADLLQWIMSRNFAADTKELCALVWRGERPRAPGAAPVPSTPRPVQASRRSQRSADEAPQDDAQGDEDIPF